MLSFKRKGDVLEICHHKEACFRKNPHHFREYGHPHLTEYLNAELPAKLPASFTQTREHYAEQLTILRGLQIPKKQAQECNLSKPNEVSTPQSSGSSSDVKPKDSSGAITKFPPNYISMQSKLDRTAPLNIFFNEIPSVAQTKCSPKNNSITFQDLLCPSLGKLKDSLQFNFVIDVVWLMQQYYVSNYHKLPITLIYGDNDYPRQASYMAKNNMTNVTHAFCKPSDPFGTHHSKMGIYRYIDDSVRVVISTANLYEEDWTIYNQALWVSPRCNRLDDSQPATSGESPTGFKKCLLNYMRHYKLDCLSKWIQLIERADFCEIKVHLITSVPGYHQSDSVGSHMHRVAKLLSTHCSLDDSDSGTIVAQASSLGSYGARADDWLLGAFLKSLSSTNSRRDLHLASKSSSLPHLQLVYPSKRNVMENRFGPDGAGCLPYSATVHSKQTWLKTHCCQWYADRRGRSRVMPHIKSYTRFTPCMTRAVFHLITSANASKAAWGTAPQANSSARQKHPIGTSYMRSYEVGVMFLPAQFGCTVFEVDDGNGSSQIDDKSVSVPIMYSVPLLSYEDKDEPYSR